VDELLAQLLAAFLVVTAPTAIVTPAASATVAAATATAAARTARTASTGLLLFGLLRLLLLRLRGSCLGRLLGDFGFVLLVLVLHS
jgi:hypothetical protein